MKDLKIEKPKPRTQEETLPHHSKNAETFDKARKKKKDRC